MNSDAPAQPLNNTSGIRLSVMVSCYQNTRFFRPTLDSILRVIGSRHDAELLICDDGSPAGGDGDTAREYAAKYPRLIRVFRNDSNSGISVSYSRLLAEARGDYVMPFDCDDILLPFDVDGAMAFLDAHTEYCAHYAKKRLFSEEKGDLLQNHGGDPSNFALAFNPRQVHNAMVIRASDIKRAGGYASPYYKRKYRTAVDVSMWIQLGLEKKFYFDDSIRSFYRVHPSQYSINNTELYKEEYAMLRTEIVGHNPELFENIRASREFKVSRSRLPLIDTLMGIDIITAKTVSPSTLAKFAQAERIFPDDYAIPEYKIKTLMQMERFKDAMDAAQEMYVRFFGHRYIELVSLQMILQLCDRLSMPKAVYSRIHRAAEEKFFALTPEQQSILDGLIPDKKA